MDNSRKPTWKRTEEKTGPVLKPLEVEVRNNNMDEAIKILRQKMTKDGVLTEIKNRRHAEKKSDKKRRKAREAVKKMRRSRGKKARVRAQVRSKER